MGPSSEFETENESTSAASASDWVSASTSTLSSPIWEGNWVESMSSKVSSLVKQKKASSSN